MDAARPDVTDIKEPGRNSVTSNRDDINKNAAMSSALTHYNRHIYSGIVKIKSENELITGDTLGSNFLTTWTRHYKLLDIPKIR